MTGGIPGKEAGDTSRVEVDNINVWSEKNRMPLNMKKTWEIVVRGNVSRPLPASISTIERKTWLRILGITLQDNPCNWDLHIEELINKASSRMYIMGVCKYYDLFVNSLIMSIFTYGIELWGCAY